MDCALNEKLNNNAVKDLNQLRDSESEDINIPV